MNFRLVLRDAWARLLRMVPLVWFSPMRTRYAATPPGYRRRLLHAMLRLLRYRQPDPTVATFRLPDAPDFAFVNANSVIVRRLFWYGVSGHEGPEVRLWQRACNQATGILEIGANIGLYTVCGASAAKHVPYTAVEPHPQTCAILRRNLALNRLDRVDVIESAVVGTKTTSRMKLMIPALDQEEAPMGSFLVEGGEFSKPSFQEFEVPVVEARTLTRSVDLIKLDVEGYEYEILSSISEDIARNRPTIFTEVLAESKKLQKWVPWLCQEHGYRIYACTTEGPIEIKPDELLQKWFGQQHEARDVVLVGAADWLTRQV